jgi:hypothetical protein
MKNLLLFTLLSLTIAVSTILHVHRKNTSDEENSIDSMRESLKEITALLPATTNVSFRSNDNNPEITIWGRYLLAPRYCSSLPEDKLDTILYVGNLNLPDTMLDHIPNKKIIAQSKNDKFRFLLVSKH